jgi:hypothetical protein
VLIGYQKYGITMKIIKKLEDKLMNNEKDYFVIFAKIRKNKDI